MFQGISKYLFEKIDDIIFTQLKEGKSIDVLGYTIDDSFKIPLLTQDLVSKVKKKESSDIDIKSMIPAMIKVIGIDNEFNEKEKYINFLKKYDLDIGEKILKNALYYASEKKYIEALIHCKAAFEFLGDTLNVLYNYARICDELSEVLKEKDKEKSEAFFIEANEVFNFILEKYPEFPDVYYYLGFHFALDNEYIKAKEYFKIAIRKGINDDKKMKIVDVLKDIEDQSAFEKGSQLIMNQRFQEGLEKLLPLEEFHQEWWNLLFFIGVAYRHLEKFDEAIKYFKRTLKYNTGHIETFNELGISYLSIGDLSSAKKAYGEALRLAPKNHELLCNMAIVYLNNNEIEEAEKYLDKAFKEKPEDPIVEAWRRKILEIKKNK